MSAPAKHLRGDVQQTVNGWKLSDTIFRWRTSDVLRKSQLGRHLPVKGLLLDLGSGLGHIAESLMREAPGRSCVMMDPVTELSPYVVRRTADLPCYPMKGSGTDLPFPDATFDGVWSAFVLHHVLAAGQERALDEVRRVLRPGGVFVLLEDTPTNDREAETVLRADRRTNFEGEEEPHHYRRPDEWQRVLSRHGFVVEHEIAFARVFPAVTIRAVPHRAFVCRRR